MKPKYQLGQKAKFAGDPDSEAGEIIGMNYTSDNGWVYTISSKGIDFDKKEIVEGVKTLRENEVVVL